MKNKALIITVAGKATRFRKSIGKDVLKAIYKDESGISILDVLLKYADDIFDKILIVGGYQYDELQDFIKAKKIKNIELIFNKNFKHGSNESLICGIKHLKMKYKEIVFVEGDLIIDFPSFLKIAQSKKNVISYNTHEINANKAVAYYIDKKDKIKYIYDTNHRYLKINLPFKSIKNSGQIWKFTNRKLIDKISRKFDDTNLDDTNLETIEKYFDKIKMQDIDEIKINTWYNCNTIDDYDLAINYILGENYGTNK